MRSIFVTLLLANIALVTWWALGMAPGRMEPVETPEWVARVGVPRLTLLEEVARSSESRPIASPLLDAAPASCRMLGPVAEQEAASHLAAQLAAYGFSTEVQPFEQTIGQTYWVYLDSGPTPGNLDTRQAILRARGIDNFIISEGPLAGSIAVGVYGDGAEAAARADEMRRRGLSSRIKLVSQTQTEYWITVIPGPSQLITRSGWKSALHADIPLQEKEIFCPDVASR